jgi:uncharacterized Zn finger protein
MATKSKTWWGKTLIAALEGFMEPGRLSRGRSYSGPNRLKTFELKDGKAIAKVRGNVNPYFGVYKEPTYETQITFQPITAADWKKIIATIGSQANFVSKLLLNEIPENIEDCFNPLKLSLLPKGRKDCVSSCSCPDWGDPCKHVAGVYYRIAEKVDRDPFVLFELRGISRKELQAELSKSNLGQALSDELNRQGQLPPPATSHFTRPVVQALPKQVSLKAFWQGEKPLSEVEIPVAQSTVPAVVIKKQGDYPAFWHRDGSFIAAMEEFYTRVKAKNQDFLD